MHVSEKRFFVKICAGPKAGGNPVIYHKTAMRFELFIKWKWYFDYRAALYKVQNPRHYVELISGGYDYIPPKDRALKSLKNRIAAKKAAITKYDRLLKLAEVEGSRELFPIQESLLYQRAVDKIEKLKAELSDQEAEFCALSRQPA